MGMVWEASQKGVPFLGVPANSLNLKQVHGSPFRIRWNPWDHSPQLFDGQFVDPGALAAWMYRRWSSWHFVPLDFTFVTSFWPCSPPASPCGRTFLTCWMPADLNKNLSLANLRESLNSHSHPFQNFLRDSIFAYWKIDVLEDDWTFW